LPAGLEFHQSEVLTPPGGGILQGGWYETADLQVAPRVNALYLLTFVEQVTLKNGMVLNADHAKISAFYKDCCTGPNAGKEPQDPQPRLQPDMPGGALPLDWGPTPGLKRITFDVVSFRRAEKPGTGREFPADGDFISYRGSTVDSLLLFAYGGARVGSFTITGEPDWVKTEYYDFTAKVAPENVAAWKDMMLIDKRYMVRAALEDALKLKVHDDTSDHPVYELVVAKGGPKLMDYLRGRYGDPSEPRGQADGGACAGPVRSVLPNMPGRDHGRTGELAERGGPGGTGDDRQDRTDRHVRLFSPDSIGTATAAVAAGCGGCGGAVAVRRAEATGTATGAGEGADCWDCGRPY
jgi:hypothetical protein